MQNHVCNSHQLTINEACQLFNNYCNVSAVNRILNVILDYSQTATIRMMWLGWLETKTMYLLYVK